MAPAMKRVNYHGFCRFRILGRIGIAVCMRVRPRAVTGVRKQRQSMSGRLRNLAILAALTSAGCSLGNLNLGTTNYKGQPINAVANKLGWPPNETDTIAGQKSYVWIKGNALYQCRIRVTMAGDVIDTYEGSGDVNICSQYGALSGGLKGYE